MTTHKPDRIPFGIRAADWLSRWIGSWTFVLSQSALIGFWIIQNTAGVWQPDVYPFILLNLMLSLQAAYTGPVLLISANRQADRDRLLLHRIEQRAAHTDRVHSRLQRDHEVLREQVGRILDLLERRGNNAE